MIFLNTSLNLEGNVPEVLLPDKVIKRIRFENPIDPPTTDAGAKIFDYDEDGKLIDVHFEGLRPRPILYLTSKVYIV